VRRTRCWDFSVGRPNGLPRTDSSSETCQISHHSRLVGRYSNTYPVTTTTDDRPLPTKRTESTGWWDGASGRLFRVVKRGTQRYRRQYRGPRSTAISRRTPRCPDERALGVLLRSDRRRNHEHPTRRRGCRAGREPTDPLVGNPVVVALLCSFGVQQLVDSAGATRTPKTTRRPTAKNSSSTPTASTRSSARTTEPASRRTSRLRAIPSRAKGTRTSSTPTASDEVVGVSGGVYAYSYPNGADSEFDPVAAVERTVATAAGDREPKHEADEDFDRLLPRRRERRDRVLSVHRQ